MERVSSRELFLSKEDCFRFVEEHDTFLFDCDGVLWRGPTLLENSPEFLHYLHEQGKRIFFVTNNSTKSKAEYEEKFRSFGLELTEQDQIVCASQLTAAYLQKHHPEVTKAYVMGATGLMEELNKVGIECLGREDDHAVFPDLHTLDTLELEENVGAVVVGSDLRCNMVKYSKAHMYLTSYNQECIFIATNMDASLPLSNGRQGPGTGAMVSFLAAGTHREPTVVGKPSDFLVEYFLENFHIDPSKAVMIGDRLETDIMFGNKLGADTLFVLTGASSQDQVDAVEDPLLIPTFIFDSIKELYETIQS